MSDTADFSDQFPSRRDEVLIPRIVDVPWVDCAPAQLAAHPDSNPTPGQCAKILSTGTGGATSLDGQLRMSTRITHVAPGATDPFYTYHPCIEEMYSLSDSHLAPAGSYNFRPPGIVHGSGTPRFNDKGFTFFHRIGALDEDVFLRPPPELDRDAYALTDEYRIWPVRHASWYDANQAVWHDTETGPWRGTRHKWLSRNRLTGGGTLLLEVPPGWTGEGSQAKGLVEEFVVHGDITAGGLHFSRWGYASRPAGRPAGDYLTSLGATVLCVWDYDELTD
ncbi:MAG: hypothetical protein QM572_00080 [Nocardioides sp.]|uniref:hypothetical protein n=1 Tax=Nocardioides sp. TaxID=35761 RepID=UPI0039E4EFFA